jgi:hypothetical protein
MNYLYNKNIFLGKDIMVVIRENNQIRPANYKVDHEQKSMTIRPTWIEEGFEVAYRDDAIFNFIRTDLESLNSTIIIFEGIGRLSKVYKEWKLTDILNAYNKWKNWRSKPVINDRRGIPRDIWLKAKKATFPKNGFIDQKEIDKLVNLYRFDSSLSIDSNGLKIMTEDSKIIKKYIWKFEFNNYGKAIGFSNSINIEPEFYKLNRIKKEID